MWKWEEGWKVSGGKMSVLFSLSWPYVETWWETLMKHENGKSALKVK